MSTLAKVLIGLGLFIFLAIAGTIMVGGYMVKRFIGGAEKNPAIAAARLMVSMNPELEVVKVDEDSGILTIRNKKDGKTLTMNAEDIQNGKLTISDDSGESVTIGADAAAKLPSWVPAYPGAKAAGGITGSGNKGEGGMATFQTSDAPSQVMSHYKQSLEAAGFKITATMTSGEDGGSISAVDEANAHTVSVVVGRENGQTQFMLTYGNKN